MKKWIALFLALSTCLLCGCGSSETPATTTQATTEATTVATTEAATVPTTEAPVVYTNPLTGEVLDAPITTRPVSVSVSNIPDSLPHRGVADADIFYESFVNGSIVRGLALYADITKVDNIGSARSARPILLYLSKHMNAFYAHVGASNYVYKVLARSGIDHMNVDTTDDAGYSYRDREGRSNYIYEHILFVRGKELMEHITTNTDVDMTLPENADFGLLFTEDGTPAEGETAKTVDITLKYGESRKQTIMVYNEETGKYEYNQYNKTMCDELTGETEAFTNVVVMFADMYTKGNGYHFANFQRGGTGYYACGGKIIPMVWKCEGNNAPFTYFTVDGEPLSFGVGSSYIALTIEGAPVIYQ